jgi:hypothetical protein
MIQRPESKPQVINYRQKRTLNHAHLHQDLNLRLCQENQTTITAETAIKTTKKIPYL